MKSLLCNNLQISYDMQDSKKGDNTHDYIFNMLYHRINNHTVKRNFRTNFQSLKNKRGKADYKNVFTSEDESLIALQEATSTISYLKQSFGTLNIRP
jgi:hypothetical protein